MQRNTLKSFQWSFLTALLRKIILFGVFLLIAKIISKEDLGVFREFSLIIGIFTSVSFFGLKDLLIIKKENTKRIFQQLFQFSIVISFISITLLYVLAPSIGKYYKSDELSNLLLILSPLLILEMLRMSLRSYYQKKLRFKTLSLIETANVILYSLLILIYFFINLDIITLVIIFYLGNLLELILLIVWEKQLCLETLVEIFSLDLLLSSLKTFKDNKKFLLSVSINNFVMMLINDLPVIVMGLLFNPQVIGLYYLANQLIGQPVVLACNSLSQVLFPTFSLMTKVEIYQKISKFFDIVTLLVFPLFFMVVIYILNLAPYILGEKWNDALAIMIILSFSLATTMLINPISSIPYVLELPQVEMIYMLANLLLKSLALYVGHFAGFERALLYYSLTSVLIHFVFISLVTKILKASVVKTVLRILINLVPMGLFIIVYLFLQEMSLLTRLAIPTLLIISYLLILRKRIQNYLII